MRASRSSWLIAFAAGAVLYARAIPVPALRPDEQVYDAAAMAVLAGTPPGGVRGWYYADTIAVVAAARPEPRWAPLRTLDLAGACVTSAVAAEAIGAPVVALLFLLSPPSQPASARAT